MVCEVKTSSADTAHTLLDGGHFSCTVTESSLLNESRASMLAGQDSELFKDFPVVGPFPAGAVFSTES